MHSLTSLCPEMNSLISILSYFFYQLYFKYSFLNPYVNAVIVIIL
jgi:hypothetical protein